MFIIFAIWFYGSETFEFPVVQCINRLVRSNKDMHFCNPHSKMQPKLNMIGLNSRTQILDEVLLAASSHELHAILFKR